MSSLPTPRQILQPPASTQHLTRLRKDLASLVSQPNGEIALSQLELDEKTGLVVDPLYQLGNWEASLVGVLYVLCVAFSTLLCRSSRRRKKGGRALDISLYSDTLSDR